MKHLMKQLCVLVATFLLVGSLGAQTLQQEPESIRIFESILTPAGKQAFVSAMQTRGSLQDGSVQLSDFYQVVYDNAKANDFLRLAPESNRTAERYKEIFRRWNGIQSHVKELSVDEIVAISRSRGWWLPVTEGVGAKVRVLRESYKTFRADTIKTNQQHADELAMYNERLTLIDTKSGELSAAVATLQSNFTAIQEGRLSEQAFDVIGRHVFETLMPKINEQFAQVNSRINDIDARIDTVETQSAAVVTRVESVEKSFQLYVAIAIVVICVLALLLLYWTGRNAEKRWAKNVPALVKTVTTAVIESIGASETKQLLDADNEIMKHIVVDHRHCSPVDMKKLEEATEIVEPKTIIFIMDDARYACEVSRNRATPNGYVNVTIEGSRNCLSAKHFMQIIKLKIARGLMPPLLDQVTTETKSSQLKLAS